MDQPDGTELPIPLGFRLENTLFDARRMFIYGEITQNLARDVTQKLIAMSELCDDDIILFINSQGGHVESADTIHDMIRFVRPRVKMVGTGWVASAGAHIYLAPPRADRFALKNTRFMLHQPHGGVRGQASDIGIEAREIVKMRQRLNQIIAEQTGQPIEKVQEDTDRNFWMGVEEARAYGIVGKVIDSSDDL